MFLETQQNTAKDLTPMPDQFEHYITKNIKSFYKRRLLTPILYLIFLLVLWFVLSLSAPLSGHARCPGYPREHLQTA